MNVNIIMVVGTNNKEKKVVINLNELKEGTCTVRDFGGGDKRAVCMEKDKLKIFKLSEENES